MEYDELNEHDIHFLKSYFIGDSNGIKPLEEELPQLVKTEQLIRDKSNFVLERS
jgi:hypothetical protein